MNCSGSSSTSLRTAALCLAAAGLACASAPRARPAALGERARIAVLPIVSLAGSAAPLAPFRGAVAAALRARGVQVAGDAEVDAFLERHRVRDTSGIDGRTAQALREELAVEAVAIASVDRYATVGIPSFAMTLRLVSAEAEDPAVLWIDGWARDGGEAPGLLGTGVVTDVRELERSALDALASGLAAFLRDGAPADPCASGRRLAPVVRFRRKLRPNEERPRLVVLPFHNQSPRGDAGDVVSLQVLKHLVATGAYQILDPGVVQSALLRSRVVMEGGVTHEAARTALGAQRVDVVLGGTVFAFGDRVEFTTLAIETWENRVVWESRSSASRVPPLVLFGRGTHATAEGVACRMARAVVGELVAAWKQANGRTAPRGRGGPVSPPERRGFDASARSASVAPPGRARPRPLA